MDKIEQMGYNRMNVSCPPQPSKKHGKETPSKTESDAEYAECWGWNYIFAYVLQWHLHNIRFTNVCWHGRLTTRCSPRISWAWSLESNASAACRDRVAGVGQWCVPVSTLLPVFLGHRNVWDSQMVKSSTTWIESKKIFDNISIYYNWQMSDQSILESKTTTRSTG